MADGLTPEQARRIADEVMGHGRGRSLDDVIRDVARTHADDKPGRLQQYDTGWAPRDEDESEELRSGCPDDSPPHNPWRAD